MELMSSASWSPGSSRKEITEHWEWLEHNLLQTLSIFENENDITTFVKGKVQVSSAKRRLDMKRTQNIVEMKCFILHKLVS